MSALLFRDDAYLREAEAVVLARAPDGGVVLDRTLGRARELPAKAPALKQGLMVAFRRFMRDGS